MLQKKVRIIRPGNRPAYGIGLPRDIGILKEGIFFRVEQRGDDLLLISGCKYEFSEEEINNYEFEGCMV